MDNKEILASLAALESSLEEIMSAKGQVDTVVQSANMLFGSISSYKDALENISKSIALILADSKEFNLKTLNNWEEKIAEIQNETSKLKKTVISYDAEMKNHQKEMVEEFGKELKATLTPIDDKVSDLAKFLEILENQASTLKDQIDRFAAVGIESDLNNIISRINSLEKNMESMNKSLSAQIDMANKNTAKMQKAISTALTSSEKKVLTTAQNQSSLLSTKITIFGIVVILLIFVDIILKSFN